MTKFSNKYFKVGSVVSPTTSSLSNLPLDDLDPIIYGLQRYLYNVLDLHLGDRLSAERVAQGLSDGYVNQILSYNPLPFKGMNEYKFPLMAIYRTEDEFENTTLAKYSVKSNIEILFLFEPWDTNQYERLHPFLRGISNIFVNRLKNSYDINYNDGEEVLKDTGIEEVRIINTSYNKFAGINGNNEIHFPGLLLTIEVKEIESDYSGNSVDTLEGIDTGYDTDDDYEVVDQIVDF